MDKGVSLPERISGSLGKYVSYRWAFKADLRQTISPPVNFPTRICIDQLGYFSTKRERWLRPFLEANQAWDLLIKYDFWKGVFNSGELVRY